MSAFFIPRARRALLICAALVAAALPAAAQMGPPPGAGGPMTVGVMQMQRSDVPRSFTLPGRAVARAQVGVRPRVGGVITEILYEPGRRLEAGAPLLRLDDASYAADVAAAEAALAKAEANLPIAEAAADRARKLEGTGISSADAQSARATAAGARADLASAKAALDFARTQLSWTEIRSPIRGYAEVAAVSVGDLVTAGQTEALTTITTLDPIDVDMLEPSARILSIRQLIDSGALKRTGRLTATLTLENGETYVGAGELVAPGRSVSTTTGTVNFRFRFDNPEGKILPGMFVRGTIELGTMSAFLIPQRAATRGADGRLSVFLLGADDKAEARELDGLGVHDNAWIVTEGLTEGETLILDGMKSLRAGMAVAPRPASIDAEGLVVDAPASASPAGAPAPAPASASAPAAKE